MALRTRVTPSFFGRGRTQKSAFPQSQESPRERHGRPLGRRADLMSPAGLICGRVVVADCKTRLVLLLEGILLFGTMMSGGSSDSVACCWSAAGSFSFVALHRPAYTRFLAARKRGLGDGGIARQERTGPSVSIEMMVDAGDAAVVASAGRERSQAAQAYYERKRQSLSAWSEERRGRDLCERCRRARKVRQSRLVGW